MKIIRLSTFLDFGGVERRLANIAHHQDKNEWVFACFDRKGIAAKEIESQGKRVENLNTKASIYSIGTLWKTYRFLKKEKPDVMHTSGAEANFHGILAAKLAGVPTIIGEEIGTPNHSKKAQMIFSFVYKFADYVIGNSQAVLNVVHKLDKVPRKKLVKIANPVLFKEIIPSPDLSFPSESFNIISVSRLEKVKNIEGVLSVMKSLKDTDYKVHYWIIGSGVIEEDLRKLVASLNLSDFVTFLGFKNNPLSYVQQADLYLLNSFTEGFSNSLAEAMYSKTPSLSTRSGAAEEIISDGVNGFLTDVADNELLYNNLIKIISLPSEQLKSIGERGHETIVQNYSLKKHIERLMEIYKT